MRASPPVQDHHMRRKKTFDKKKKSNRDVFNSLCAFRRAIRGIVASPPRGRWVIWLFVVDEEGRSDRVPGKKIRVGSTEEVVLQLAGKKGKERKVTR